MDITFKTTMILKNIIYNFIYLLDYYTINHDNIEFTHILFVFLQFQSHIGRGDQGDQGGRGGPGGMGSRGRGVTRSWGP